MKVKIAHTTKKGDAPADAKAIPTELAKRRVYQQATAKASFSLVEAILGPKHSVATHQRRLDANEIKLTLNCPFAFRMCRATGLAGQRRFNALDQRVVEHDMDFLNPAAVVSRRNHNDVGNPFCSAAVATGK